MHRRPMLTAVGKPSAFSGKETEWPAWCYKFITWLSSQYGDAEEVLDWAAMRGSETITQQMIEGILEAHPKAGEMNQQLHAIMTALTTSGTDAFSIVKNTPKRMGLDAWRRIVRKFDPNNPVANLRLLKKIMQPPQVSMDQLPGAIEQWEQHYTHYMDRTREQLTDSMRRAVLQSMCPTVLS